MLINLIIGVATLVACLGIQCLAMAVMLRDLRRLERLGLLRQTIPSTLTTLVVITLILVAGSLAQIALWAVLFLVCDEFTNFATAFYHSVVNFSTLGYGDIVMSEGRRLLGALEALNGVLMVGLSTSTLFAVLNVMLQKAWHRPSNRKQNAQGEALSSTHAGGAN